MYCNRCTLVVLEHHLNSLADESSPRPLIAVGKEGEYILLNNGRCRSEDSAGFKLRRPDIGPLDVHDRCAAESKKQTPAPDHRSLPSTSDHRERKTEADRDRQRQRDGQRQTETDRETETERQRQRQMDIQTQRQTDTEAETDRQTTVVWLD